MTLSRYDKVRIFMQHIGQAVPQYPIVDMKEYPCELRARLVLEEAQEFVEACGRNNVDFEPVSFHNRNPLTPDRTKAVDGLIDILVVTYGALAALGLSEAQVDELFDEVNMTNEAKVNGPVNEFGKRLKPPGWKPPRIAEILQKFDDKVLEDRSPGIMIKESTSD